MKILVVTGDFNDGEGRPSGYGNKLVSEINREHFVKHVNGGNYGYLQGVLELLYEFDVVLWFANVPNDKEKIVSDIKKKHPRVMLVTSKANFENKYGTMDIIAHALKNKSNLVVEFKEEDRSQVSKDGDGKQFPRNKDVVARVMDPLGNVFTPKTETGFTSVLKYVADAITERVIFLRGIKRIGCNSEILPVKGAPDVEDFITVVKNHGEEFNAIIHGLNTTRYLGNASFRCEQGFPSFKDGELIYVSKRNVDKRGITRDSFIAVEPKFGTDIDMEFGSSGDYGEKDVVVYYGTEKPSVDTPIQIKLYNYYSNVKYMIHGHVYVEGAPFTKRIISCGSIEEFEEIIRVRPDMYATNFSVNLIGHGSITLVQDLEHFKAVEYRVRNIPEYYEGERK